MTAISSSWIGAPFAPSPLPPIDVECLVRRISAGIGIELLRILGGSQVGQVVEFIDRVRDQLIGRQLADQNAIHEHVVHEAHWWVQDRYQVRLLSPLEREKPENRLAALLWSSHSALPPQPSHAVLLRCLCALSVSETSALLGISQTAVATQVNRAARRVRAFRLEIKPATVTNRLGLKMAEQRLRTLQRQCTRPGTPIHLAQSIAEWLAFVHSFRGRTAA